MGIRQAGQRGSLPPSGPRASCPLPGAEPVVELSPPRPSGACPGTSCPPASCTRKLC